MGSLFHLLFKELTLICTRDYSSKLEKERAGDQTVWEECCGRDVKGLRGGISALRSYSNRNTMDWVVYKQEVISYRSEGGKSEIRVLASSNSGEKLLAGCRCRHIMSTHSREQREEASPLTTYKITNPSQESSTLMISWKPELLPKAPSL